MTGNDLAKMFEMSHMALNRNLADLTHEDSLFIPEPAGNCINWALGHILIVRDFLLLVTIGAKPLLSAEESAPYKRGSEALKSDTPCVRFDRLKEVLEESQKRLIPAMQGLSDEVLAAEVPEKYRQPPLVGPLGLALARFYSHEGYHNGQIGLLRRLAGKESAIK